MAHSNQGWHVESAAQVTVAGSTAETGFQPTRLRKQEIYNKVQR
jgi:hypothetical protein